MTIKFTLREDLEHLENCVNRPCSAGFLAVALAAIINRIEDQTGHTIAPAIAETARMARQLDAA